jgi:plastocyanin
VQAASINSRKTPIRLFLILSSFLVPGIVCTLPARAALIVGFVADRNGQAVQDAVVYATPLDAPVPAAGSSTPAVIAQENYAFVPYVTVVRPGTPLRFPNRDPHDHHLKSLSAANPFELRVYNRKEEPAPVAFDTPGEVALVCHLHDWMRGYIFVADTPYAAKTDKAGNALLRDLPPGKYEVKAWAPNMLVAPPAQQVQVTAAGSNSMRFQLGYVPKPAPRPRQPSSQSWSHAY